MLTIHVKLINPKTQIRKSLKNKQQLKHYIQPHT